MGMPMQWTDPLTGRQMIDSHPNHQICRDCKVAEQARLNEAFMDGLHFGRTPEQVADLWESQRLLILSALEESMAKLGVE